MDLTQRVVDVTTTRLTVFGFSFNLQRIDIEVLPFVVEFLDIVYSCDLSISSEE